MEFDSVTSPDPVDMRALAKAMKVDYDEIRDLNPAFKSQVAPVLTSVATVRVPAGTSEAAKLVVKDCVIKNKKYVAQVETGGEGNFTRYRVKRGETLSGIAQRFDVSVDKIVKVNNIHRNRIRPGQTLRIPSSAFSVKTRKTYSSHTRHHTARPVVYVVRKGDTLSRIAANYDVSVKQLVKKNRLSKLHGKVLRGQRLLIPTA